MNSNLYHGRFIPPKSYAQAVKTHRKLSHEIRSIERQLANEVRHLAYSAKAYAAWRTSAGQALKVFRAEHRQLEEWMAREVSGEKLFREAYDLLNTLEVECEFSKEETDLMTKLDAHFTAKEDAHGRQE